MAKPLVDAIDKLEIMEMHENSVLGRNINSYLVQLVHFAQHYCQYNSLKIGNETAVVRSVTTYNNGAKPPRFLNIPFRS